MKNPFDRKPKPPADQVRVDLPDDHWVMFHAEIRHGTTKAVGALTRKHLKMPEGASAITIGQDGGVKAQMKGDLEVDVTAIDWVGVTDAIILHQADTWSFGDLTVDVLDMMPERLHKALADEVNRLWGGVDSGPLPVTVDGS